ncbi:MAG: hypothetical protein JXQ99_26875 [Hyphomicrobiaceae bacterium]
MPEDIRRFVPILHWLPGYSRQDLASDGLAGLIVAIMLVPQAMAYALLAGLPPETGLYASILPLVLYGILGSSRTLAVGPVAIVSLMVASTVGNLAESGTQEYMVAALFLALLSGTLLMVMGLLRLGFLVNFLSHPVISGFTSAAALVIGFSQLKHLLGLDIPRSHLITDTLWHAASRFGDINLVAVALGLGAFGVLLLWRSSTLPQWLERRGVPDAWINPLTKAGPLGVVAITTLLVWIFGLDLSDVSAPVTVESIF